MPRCPANHVWATAALAEIAERTLKRDLTTLRDAGVLESEGERKGTTYRLAL